MQEFLGKTQGIFFVPSILLQSSMSHAALCFLTLHERVPDKSSPKVLRHQALFLRMTDDGRRLPHYTVNLIFRVTTVRARFGGRPLRRRTERGGSYDRSAIETA